MDFDSRWPRRDDQVRGAEVRLGPRRADRHVLHDQGAGRGARRGARARLPVRGRRQDRQAHAAADHGPRHAAVRVPRAAPEVRGRLQDGRRAPRALRAPTRRRRGSSTSPRDSRVSAARTASTPPRWSSPGSRSPSTSRCSASRSRAATIEDAPIVTQYEMHGVEELGLLKMDFLGLRNLDVIEITLDLVEQGTGVRPGHRQRPARRRARPSSCCATATRSACSSSRVGRCAR